MLPAVPVLFTTPYCLEARALFARAAAAGAEPDASHRAAINALIVGLKGAGTWPIRDWFHFIGANATITGLNFKADQYNLTPFNSPTFLADRYYQGNGTSSYLEITGAVRNALANYTQNSANLAVWCLDGTAANTFMLGTSGSSAQVAPRAVGDIAAARINASGSLTGAVATGGGYTAGNRSASNARQLYKNGALLANDTGASGSLSADTFYYMRTSGSTYSAFPWLAGAAGGSLTAQQHADEYAVIHTYLQTIGAAP